MQGGTVKGVGTTHRVCGDTGGRRAASEPSRSEANEAREQRWIRCRLEEGGGVEEPELPIRRWGSFMISKRAAMSIKVARSYRREGKPRENTHSERPTRYLISQDCQGKKKKLKVLGFSF